MRKPANLFIQQHLKLRKGEAKRRLKDGHGHAEQLFLRQVWWPAFGNFEFLHPEYEIQDYVRERPRQCQQLLQQMMGRWLSPNVNDLHLTISEKEIIRLAKRIMRPITPLDVSTQLDICRRTAQKHLQQLLIKQVFTPEGGGSIRIRSYRLQVNRPDLYL